MRFCFIFTTMLLIFSQIQAYEPLKLKIIRTSQTSQGLEKNLLKLNSLVFDKSLCNQQIQTKKPPTNCYKLLQNLYDLGEISGQKLKKGFVFLDKLCEQTISQMQKYKDVLILSKQSYLSPNCYKKIQTQKKILEYIMIEENPQQLFNAELQK